MNDTTPAALCPIILHVFCIVNNVQILAPESGRGTVFQQKFLTKILKRKSFIFFCIDAMLRTELFWSYTTIHPSPIRNFTSLTDLS